MTGSGNVGDWLWYESATTPSGCFSISDLIGPVLVGGRGIDCAFIQTRHNYIDDWDCSDTSSDSNFPLCEFLIGIFKQTALHKFIILIPMTFQIHFLPLLSIQIVAPT